MQSANLIRVKDAFVKDRVSVPVKSELGLTVILKEHDPHAKLRTVQIYNVPKDTLLINLHNVNPEVWLKGLLEASSGLGLLKCCDYVLLSVHDMIFIELKSRNPVMSEVKKQLKSGTCLFTYCSSVLGQFYNINIPFPGVGGDCNAKYVLVSSKGGGNKRTFGEKTKYHHTPENPYHYKVANKSYAQINYQSLI